MSWQQISDKADKIITELEDNQKFNLEDCHDKIKQLLSEHYCTLNIYNSCIILTDINTGKIITLD